MSAQSLLDDRIRRQFELLRGLIDRCRLLAEQCGDPKSVALLNDKQTRLDAAALFVIVGEVKAGKSSFANALLGEKVCEVAPDPCTAVIQEIAHGQRLFREVLGPQWERLSMPAPMLEYITIVDTPGTNSIVRNHQTITEQYIPRSDVVIFVFPAKNPYTFSAWDLLGLIKEEWHRKMVFVLQQADLTTPEELATNMDRVRQYALERHVQNPVIFALSAKQELEGVPDSGFAPFREYLRETVATGEVWKIKIESARETLRSITGSLLLALRTEVDSITADRKFFAHLEEKLASRRNKAAALQRLAVDSLSLAYDRLTRSLEDEFRAGLSIGTVLRRSVPFLRDMDIRTWVARLQLSFEEQSRQEIEKEASRISSDLSSEIEGLFEELNSSLEKHRQQTGFTRLQNSTERVAILDSLRDQLRDIRLSDILQSKGLEGSDLGTLTLAGGGIAALGAAVAFASHMAVLDITGGVLAGIGALLVAGTLLWKRSGILSDFSRRLAASRETFRSRIESEIGRLFDRLYVEIAHLLEEPSSRLKNQEEKLRPLLEDGEAILQELGALGGDSPD